MSLSDRSDAGRARKIITAPPQLRFGSVTAGALIPLIMADLCRRVGSPSGDRPPGRRELLEIEAMLTDDQRRVKALTVQAHEQFREGLRRDSEFMCQQELKPEKSEP